MDTTTFPTQVRGTWTLTGSLIHGGDETLGTTRLFRTKGFITAEGRKIRLPVVSGNALRGLWRRHCAMAFLDAYLAAGGAPLDLPAFYFLTSGGSLRKGVDSGALDLASEQQIRALIPYAGCFGGASLGRIQEGKLWVDEPIPICRETVPLLRHIYPAVDDAATATLSIRDLTEVHGYSRQDDAKNVHWHRYLTPQAQAGVTALVAQQQATDEAASAGTPQQMRYEQQELCMGTVLFHRWGFHLPPTPHELAGLGAGILRWAARAHIGGRNAVGHGTLLPVYEGVTPDVRLLTDGSQPLEALRHQTVDEVLRAHVQTHHEAIRDLLRRL